MWPIRDVDDRWRDHRETEVLACNLVHILAIIFLFSESSPKDSTATTLAQVFGKEIDVLRDRNISAVAATTDNASNLIKNFSGDLLPGTFCPRQPCSAHTAQLGIFDDFGEGRPHADLTMMIRHVCETASANRKACPFFASPRAPHWNNIRWNILYRMTGYLTANESKIAIVFAQLQLQTEYEFVTIGPWRSVHVAMEAVHSFTTSVEASLVSIGEMFSFDMIVERRLMQLVDAQNVYAFDLLNSVRTRFTTTTYISPPVLAFLLHPDGKKTLMNNRIELLACLQYHDESPDSHGIARHLIQCMIERCCCQFGCTPTEFQSVNECYKWGSEAECSTLPGLPWGEQTRLI
jgi:hypothetical protein